MSKVIRISDQVLNELDIFKIRYLKELERLSNDSDLLNSILQEKLNYSDSDWISFAIRFACNNAPQE